MSDKDSLKSARSSNDSQEGSSKDGSSQKSNSEDSHAETEQEITNDKKNGPYGHSWYELEERTKMYVAEYMGKFNMKHMQHE